MDSSWFHKRVIFSMQRNSFGFNAYSKSIAVI